VRRTVPPSAEIEAQIDQLLAVGVGDNPRESLSELGDDRYHVCLDAEARVTLRSANLRPNRHTEDTNA
jgi:hypothetical protein